jgi:hypothetical protein
MKTKFLIAAATAALLTAVGAHSATVWHRGGYAFENEPELRVHLLRAGEDLSRSESVEYYTIDDTARAGVDFVQTRGTATFAPGQSVFVASIPLIDNSLVDGDRKFFVALTNPSPGFFVGCYGEPDGCCAVAIRDNEFPRSRTDPLFQPEVVPSGRVFEMPDGRILFGSRFGLRMLNADGTVDVAFQLEQLSSALPPIDYSSYSGHWPVHVFPDGRILLVAAEHYSDQLDGLIFLVKPNGSLEATVPIPTSSRVLAAQDDLKLLIWSCVETKSLIRRIHLDGRADGSFNEAEVAGIPAAANAWILPDSKIFLSGWFTHVNGTDGNNIARLNDDGSLDQSFAPPLNMTNVSIRFVRRSGKVVVHATVENANLSETKWLQLNTDGTLDEAFDGSNLQEYIGFVFAETADERLLLADGETLVRTDPSGRMDLAFEPARFTLTDTGFRERYEHRCSEFGVGRGVHRDLTVLKSGQVLYVNSDVGFLRLRNQNVPSAEFRVNIRQPLIRGEVAEVEVVRTGESSSEATVDFRTQDGTAKAGTHYIAQAGRLTFAPLEVVKRLTIPLLSDPVEPRDLYIELLNASAAYTIRDRVPIRLTELRITSLQKRLDSSYALNIKGTVPGLVTFSTQSIPSPSAGGTRQRLRPSSRKIFAQSFIRFSVSNRRKT